MQRAEIQRLYDALTQDPSAGTVRNVVSDLGENIPPLSQITYENFERNPNNPDRLRDVVRELKLFLRIRGARGARRHVTRRKSLRKRTTRRR